MLLVLNAIRLALSAILRNKTRAALTVLGILIGIAAVVTVTALGEGASKLIAGQIDSLGTNVIFVLPQPTQQSGARGKVTGRLTESDARGIAQGAVSVAGVAPYLQTLGQVVNGEKNAATTIIGTTLPYFSLRTMTFTRGDVWTESDEVLKTKVCVVGATVVTKLFGKTDPVGRILRIGRAPYRIVGVYAPRGTTLSGEDEDNRVVMPIGSFRARVMPTSPGRADLIVAASTTEHTTARALEQIDGILRQRHRIGEGKEPDFVVRTQAEFRKTQESVMGAVSMLLLSVAAVSLLVGGIGVMNIMLVTIAERTREIGIRMSIGARQRDILTQFLVEAVVLSMVGGALGMATGVSLTLGLGQALDWPMFPSGTALAVAISTSALIGVVFGYVPARRAASLDPIEALRTD
ncbi:MAG: ABC transporter permease [Polyangiaceae bacterium]